MFSQNVQPIFKKKFPAKNIKEINALIGENWKKLKEDKSEILTCYEREYNRRCAIYQEYINTLNAGKKQKGDGSKIKNSHVKVTTTATAKKATTAIVVDSEPQNVGTFSDESKRI